MRWKAREPLPRNGRRTGKANSHRYGFFASQGLVFPGPTHHVHDLASLGKQMLAGGLKNRFLGAWHIVPLALLSLTLSSCESVSQQEAATNAPAHHARGGFKNLHIEDSRKNFFDFMAMKHFGDTEWADHAARAAEVPVRDLDMAEVQSKPQSFRVSWLGHSTFLIQWDKINVLTDPAFAERVSPVSFAGPKRYTRHVVDYATLPKIDYVVISHNHYDHLDEAAVRVLGNQPIYLVPLGLKPWFIEQGVRADRVREMDWWDRTAFAGITFQAMPSQHWSARGLFDRRKTLWASWLIALDERQIWFAGDTGYNPVQFKEIGRATGGVDLALIPIGGYAPRSFMRLYHVNPEEAIKIHRDIGSKMSIGMHWGTYPLTAEGPIDPVVELDRQRKAYRLKPVEFITMKIGESITR